MRSFLHLRSMFCGAWAVLCWVGATGNALAQSQLSEASFLSTVPIVASVGVGSALLGAGGSLAVVGVEASAEGVSWLLERTADGSRASLQLSRAAAGAALTVGAVVTVSALGTGWLLSSGGRAVAFVPNAQGRALLYHEQVTR